MLINMKVFFVFFLLFFNSTEHQRGVGTIRATIFHNNNCNLNSNIQLDSVEIMINSSRLDNPIKYTCLNSVNQETPYLESGKYDVTYINPDGENILVKNVGVSAEKITFVYLLIEPNCDLNIFQKRVRRKRYQNYKR